MCMTIYAYRCFEPISSNTKKCLTSPKISNFSISKEMRQLEKIQFSVNLTFPQTKLQFFIPLICAFLCASWTADSFISMPTTWGDEKWEEE